MLCTAVPRHFHFISKLGTLFFDHKSGFEKVRNMISVASVPRLIIPLDPKNGKVENFQIPDADSANRGF
jgi:hypothetical protein